MQPAIQLFSAETAMHPGKTILLADDCPTIRAIL